MSEANQENKVEEATNVPLIEEIRTIELPQETWEQKEAEYQKQIANLKKLNEKLINYSEDKAKHFEYETQKLNNEKEIIRKRLEKMEMDELKASAVGASSKSIEAFKEKYDGVLRKAQDLLFERQKVIKSLELKLEAQNVQIISLKDVVALTKDMLVIRDVEVRELTERLEAFDSKFKAEKDRKTLMQKKMDLSDKLNSDLKAEYKAQKEIFNILKDQYKSKVVTLEKQLKDSRLNAADQPSTSS